MTIRIGISGWRYPPWRGSFYPKGLRQDDELAYASTQLSSIEINGSFYSLQRPESYAEWYAATPKDFVFANKGNRFLTHTLRLRDAAKPLANVMASGVFALREKLGPFLWQLPPNSRFDADRLEGFLSLLPHDTEAALALARRHEPRMDERALLEIDRKRPLRHALEVRHESFMDAAFIALLRKYKVALVVADTAGKWPYMEDVTADFMYLRLHGDTELYASGYSDAALARWAERIRAWTAGGQPQDAVLARWAERIRAWTAGGQPQDAVLAASKAPPKRASRDLYCYFDNDIKVRAPYDARRLMAMLDQA